MWSMYYDARKFLRASDENGGPLSVKNLFGGPYLEIRLCIFHMMESADFEDVWYMKGYLLKVSVTTGYSYSLLLYGKKSATRSCQGESGNLLGALVELFVWPCAGYRPCVT